MPSKLIYAGIFRDETLLAEFTEFAGNFRRVASLSVDMADEPGRTRFAFDYGKSKHREIGNRGRRRVGSGGRRRPADDLMVGGAPEEISLLDAPLVEVEKWGDTFTFHVERLHNAPIIVVLTTEAFPSWLAFLLLKAIRDEFVATFGEHWASTTASIKLEMNRKFHNRLGELLHQYEAMEEEEGDSMDVVVDWESLDISRFVRQNLRHGLLVDTIEPPPKGFRYWFDPHMSWYKKYPHLPKAVSAALLFIAIIMYFFFIVPFCGWNMARKQNGKFVCFPDQ